MSAGESAKGTNHFGKYELIERLGKGGMAEVWKARFVGPAGFARTVVLKRILPHLLEDAEFVQMFVSEARLSARLTHPNVVQVFELGNFEGEYYLAMEYVRGIDLSTLLRGRATPLPPGFGAFVVREVCHALAYAHSLTDESGTPLRLVHRDVTPSNIMVTGDGGVKLFDFGIAKALGEVSENKTQTGALKGKLGYLSPEQIEQGEVNHRVDIFAVGIVLHEVLVGRRLFKGQSEGQTISMIQRAQVTPPSKLNPAVPPELDRICLQALARDPIDRYQSCEEMANDLDQVLHQLRWGSAQLKELVKQEQLLDSSKNVRVAPPEVSPPVDPAPEPTQPATVLERLTPTKDPVRVTPDMKTTPPVVVPVPPLTDSPPTSLARVIGMGAVAVAVLMVGAFWVRDSGRFADAPPQQSTLVVAPVDKAPAVERSSLPAAIPAPSAPSVVHTQIQSTPAGAQVFVDDETTARGVTPFTLTLPRSSQLTRVEVRAKGFHSAALEVVPEKDASLALDLTQETAADRSRDGKSRAVKRGPGSAGATATQSPAPAAAPTPSTPGERPNLREGDVLDPWNIVVRQK